MPSNEPKPGMRAVWMRARERCKAIGQRLHFPHFPLWQFPIAAQILIWFFLNLFFLGVVCALIFSAQFRLNLDWVFASNARQRVESLRTLMVGELNATHPEYWSDVVDRFSQAYGVQISLFEPNGAFLIGRVQQLPEPVRERLLSFTLKFLPEARRLRTPKGALETPADPVRAFLRTRKPARYWLLYRTRLDNPRVGGPMRVILVAQADSFSMGGLILDPAPWIWLIVGTIAFSVVFWIPLLRSITRAIRQMTQTTRQIAAGRFDVRVATRRHDELGSLGESINQMAERLNGFIMGQKRFLGDIAHELCTPLARLQMTLGIMEQRGEQADNGEYARRASEKAGQIAALVNELLAFSRASFGASAVRLEAVAVRTIVAEAVKRETTEQARIEVPELPEGLAVLADTELLVRAISNLLRNAIRHGGGSVISVNAERDGESVLIRVADGGPGVPEGELLRLFDAFYRLDRSRTRETGGVGLGLTIVKTCVESSGGTVVARNREPHGLEMEIRLPAA